MITKRPSIMLGVATATVGVALLAPVLGAAAGGGGGGTHGSFPTGPNQNPNEAVRRRGQAVVAAVTEAVLPREAMACLQAPAPAAAPEAVPPGGRAVRANDRYVPIRHGCALRDQSRLSFAGTFSGVQEVFSGSSNLERRRDRPVSSRPNVSEIEDTFGLERSAGFKADFRPPDVNRLITTAADCPAKARRDLTAATFKCSRSRKARAMSGITTELIETRERQIRKAERIATDKRGDPNTRAIAAAMVLKLRR
jgi:hypothetical protein